VSSKAECPGCSAYLSAIWDVMHGERYDGDCCPSCGLPGGVIREVERARKAHADAELTRQLEEALIRAGKAEAERDQLREWRTRVRSVVAEPGCPGT